jgi:hypothetical protein
MEILAKCQQCGRENAVTVTQTEWTKTRCASCNSLLLEYTAIGGYIYVLSNPKMRDLLKIGLSTRPVQERILELSSATGVPAPFELEAYFVTMDPPGHEQQIHTALVEHRVKGKEFFEVQIAKALHVAESICGRPPTYLNPRIAPAPAKGWDWGPGKPGTAAEAYDSNYEYRIRARRW